MRLDLELAERAQVMSSYTLHKFNVVALFPVSLNVFTWAKRLGCKGDTLVVLT